MNCGSKPTYSLWREMANCGVLSQHMFRDLFFSIFSQVFSFHLWNQVGCFFVLNHHLAAYCLSFILSTYFGLPQQSASKFNKGRGLAFHLLARLLVNSSKKDPKHCVTCQYNLKSHILNHHWGLLTGAEVFQEPAHWGHSPVLCQSKILQSFPIQILQGMKFVCWS